MDKIAKRLEYFVKRSGLTWDEIEEAGINRRTLALSLKDPMHRSVATLQRICDAIGITLEDLFCDDMRLVRCDNCGREFWVKEKHYYCPYCGVGFSMQAT